MAVGNHLPNQAQGRGRYPFRREWVLGRLEGPSNRESLLVTLRGLWGACSLARPFNNAEAPSLQPESFKIGPFVVIFAGLVTTLRKYRSLIPFLDKSFQTLPVNKVLYRSRLNICMIDR